MENNNENNIQNKEQNIKKTIKTTKISIISLCFLTLRIFEIILYGFIYINSGKNFLSRIFLFPWLLTSLILAIISRVKYKDTLSKVLIIAESIIIIITTILFIALIIFSINYLGNMCDEIVNDAFPTICEMIGSCKEMG